MQGYIGIEHREHFRKTFLTPLLASGKLQMTIPDKPTSKYQKYFAVR
jgi:ATP-dependent DNA helicase RecG